MVIKVYVASSTSSIAVSISWADSICMMIHFQKSGKVKRIVCYSYYVEKTLTINTYFYSLLTVYFWTVFVVYDADFINLSHSTCFNPCKSFVLRIPGLCKYNPLTNTPFIFDLFLSLSGESWELCMRIKPHCLFICTKTAHVIRLTGIY